MSSLVKSNRFFLVPFFAFLIFGAIFLALHSKADTHLIINSYHNSFLDAISPYITWLGDGFTAGIVVLVLLFIKYRYALLAGISSLLVSLILQVCKQTIFHTWPRPVKYFEGVHELHRVPGFINFTMNSFPSGHSATAFALYFSLSVLVKNNFLKLLFFVLALSAAFSRVYLSQHFFQDIYAGSLIGVISVFIVHYFVIRIEKNWPERSLQTLFKK